MTADVRWTIAAKWEVCGFLDAANARGHARKHFLSARERWEQIAGREDSPAQLRDTDDALDEAAGAYVRTVRRVTSRDPDLRAAAGTDREGHDHFPSIRVASSFGVFAVFHRRRPVSHLVTAYRPFLRDHRGPLRVQDYARAAREKLLRSRP